MKRLWPVFLMVGLLLLATAAAAAASPGGFTLNWRAISAGGSPASSASGEMAMNGSIGQPVAGVSAGGGSDLSAGYWIGGDPPLLLLYLPIISE